MSGHSYKHDAMTIRVVRVASIDANKMLHRTATALHFIATDEPGRSVSNDMRVNKVRSS